MIGIVRRQRHYAMSSIKSKKIGEKEKPHEVHIAFKTKERTLRENHNQCTELSQSSQTKPNNNDNNNMIKYKPPKTLTSNR